MHKAWKKHHNTVYWVDINLALKKVLKFYQTRSNAIILHETLPAYCIPKVVRMETAEVIWEKVYASPRPPPKILLKHDWKRVDDQLDNLCSNSRSSQSNQPPPNPDPEKTVQPVVGTKQKIESSGRKTSRSQEIETRSFREEAAKHDKTVQSVVETRAPKTRSSDDSKIFNVGDETIHDWTGATRCKPWRNRSRANNAERGEHGLPYSSIATFCRGASWELSCSWIGFKKIENHPDRHALQLDLQQDKAYNPFSATAKKMVKDVDNEELFDLFETDPKTQCKACLRHRQLYIRASLERRNSGQSKFHQVYDGPSFNSRIRNQEGKTSLPQTCESSRK